MIAVIITGTSQGLGQELFEKLALVSSVTIISISRRFLTNQKKLAEDHPDRIILIQQDLSLLRSREDVSSLLHDSGLNEKQSRFDEIVFISNAGVIDPICPIGSLVYEQVYNSVMVNMLSPIYIADSLVHFVLLEKVRLKIINLTSGAAERAIVSWSTYCSTKSAAKMFFNTLSEQIKESNLISVHQIDPGTMDTDMQDKIRIANTSGFPQKEYFVDLKNQGKLLSPGEVADKLITKYILS